jgi:hypothetical protein
MSHACRLLFLAAFLGLLAVAASTPVTGCSGGGGPAGPGEDLCDRITFDSNQGISIRSAFGCTSINSVNTGEQRDQFGRVLSFNFDITCTAGASERLTGRVFNVTYNNLGQFVSAQATINGKSCTYTFS